MIAGASGLRRALTSGPKFVPQRCSQLWCGRSRGRGRGWQQTSWISHTRQLSSDENKFRPYYVTSPIFYVNAEPHIGHLYTMLLTDVLKRWEVLKGDERATLLTGTDEHGMKVQKAAEQAELTPKELCDQNAKHFLHLAEDANVSFDRFIRTTDQDHKAAVEHFWQELNKKGFIYESRHEGWYSISDETFYPESQVHLVLDPATGRKLYASKETGKEVEWSSEINYRFRLSAFKDRLLEHYEQHPAFIVPESRMKFIKQEVSRGLEDLSISRPSSRLQWGIRVPGDDSQTIYVWLDALINYLTMTGYPFGDGDKHKLWPPNVQVIGKDIVRFHTIYWPAFLMALDIPLPRTFLTHAHWTLGSQKMSKSLGNGVSPFQVMNRYGRDTIRFFMIYAGGIADDAAYDNSFVAEHYQRNLQDQLGNMLSRLVIPKKWSVKNAVAQCSHTPPSQQDERTQLMINKINTVADCANQHMAAADPRQALIEIMNVVYDLNRYFEHSAPWTVARDDSPEGVRKLNEIIFTTAETLRIVFILLQPFMPDKMDKALDVLEVVRDRRTFGHASFGTDFTYAATIHNLSRNETRSQTRHRKRATYDHTLFPPLIAQH